MTSTFRKIALLIFTTLIGILSCGFSHADSLTTITSGTVGGNGNMFNITATGTNVITITGFSQNFSTPTAVTNFEFWTTPGGVTLAKTSNPSAWTLISSTGAFTANSAGTLTNLTFTTPISIRLTPGETLGIYLTRTVINSAQNVAYTTGTAVGAVAATNSALTIYQGYGKFYNAAFSDNVFYPRIWNGSIFYTIYPSTTSTQLSLVNTANALQPIFTLQNSILANSLTYDCSLFSQNGVCVSAGGRNTAVQAANGLNNTSGLLIASYRLDKNNSRIGLYADQNFSVNNAGNTVNLGNNTPLMGVFGAWSQRSDDIGAEVKFSASYGQKNATITRQVVGDAEAGSGSSTLNSQGAQLTAKYGFGVTETTVVSPYVGLRYTQNNMGGYTESTSTTVTAPLTYNALNTNATTVLAGLGARHHLNPKTMLMVSAGIESDTNTSNGSFYGASNNIYSLTPVNFNANPVTTRPTASLGATYLVDKNQQLGLTGIYRQEPYQGVSTTTFMATYTAGL